MHFANAVTIHRPPEEVFRYLAAFENVPKWNYAIVETHKTSDGPVAVGATYRQTRSLPSRSEETFQVVQFEPDRRLAIHGGLGPFEGTLTYELESVDEGTLLTNTAELEAHGVLKLAAPLAGGGVREAVAANLQKLKTYSRNSPFARSVSSIDRLEDLLRGPDHRLGPVLDELGEPLGQSGNVLLSGSCFQPSPHVQFVMLNLMSVSPHDVSGGQGAELRILNRSPNRNRSCDSDPLSDSAFIATRPTEGESAS